MSYLRDLCLFPHCGVQYILCCVLLCFSLPVSLDCPVFIAPSVFSNVYFVSLDCPVLIAPSVFSNVYSKKCKCNSKIKWIL